MKINLNFNSIKRAVALRKVAAFLITGILSVFSFISCNLQEEDNRVVIWTCSRDFAQYAELYNQSHKNNKVVIVYKENPAKSLPPLKDEANPDIVIGPWLQSDSVNKYFTSLDYIFDRRIISSSIFYPQLFEVGKFNDSQYLLPVSFNLPAVIYSASNNDKIKNDFTMSIDDIRQTAAEFNEKKKNGSFNKIGFTVTTNPDFLYLVSKMYGVDFCNNGEKTIWNEDKLKEAVKVVYDWVSAENNSIRTETDFDFKYLCMPDYRQVISDKTLFTYATSDRVFDILHNQYANIDYRWIEKDGKIQIEDSAIFLGIYKKTKNQAGCTEFITWFFNEANQDKILERKIDLNLDTEQFGFTGGFSSLIKVTEKSMPKYYTQLLSNVPPSQALTAAISQFPRWEDYKKSVIDPFFLDSIKEYERLETDKAEEKDTSAETILKQNITIEDYEKEWRKKLFD